MTVGKVYVFVKSLLKRDQRIGFSILNVAKSLNFFWPNTSGTYRQLSQIALEDAESTVSLISSFGDLPAELELFTETQVSEDSDEIGRAHV